MSGFQLKDMTGNLFRNDRATSPKHPSHRGTLLIDGKTYEVAAWIKEGARGRFFSLQVTAPKEGAAPVADGAPRRRTPGEYPEPPKNKGGPRRPLSNREDIPF
jgi:uncharacterized protein (DUF736 family)